MKGKTLMMNQREMLEKVIANDVNDEVIAVAQKMLAALDAKNEKAKAKRVAKNAEVNEPIKNAIRSYLASVEDADAASVQAALGLASVSKAASMLRQLVDAGIVVKFEKSVPKRGKVNFYKLAPQNPTWFEVEVEDDLI